jgi:hypothetical protein
MDIILRQLTLDISRQSLNFCEAKTQYDHMRDKRLRWIFSLQFHISFVSPNCRNKSTPMALLYRLQKHIDHALEEIVRLQTSMNGEIVQNVCADCRDRAKKIDQLKKQVSFILDTRVVGKK